jgi:hypothetical protein
LSDPATRDVLDFSKPVALMSEWRRDGTGPSPAPHEVNCYGGVGRKP